MRNYQDVNTSGISAKPLHVSNKQSSRGCLKIISWLVGNGITLSVTLCLSVEIAPSYRFTYLHLQFIARNNSDCHYIAFSETSHSSLMYLCALVQFHQNLLTEENIENILHAIDSILYRFLQYPKLSILIVNSWILFSFITKFCSFCHFSCEPLVD